MQYVMGGLRLLMEWMMVPLFAIAMQARGRLPVQRPDGTCLQRRSANGGSVPRRLMLLRSPACKHSWASSGARQLRSRHRPPLPRSFLRARSATGQPAAAWRWRRTTRSSSRRCAA